MSFKTAEATMSADVASSGTFTVAYPTNRNAGFYRNTSGHKIVTEQNDKYNWPEDFTLTFGTGSITVTWGNARTLTNGTKVYVQLNEPGDDEKRFDGGLAENLLNYRARPMTRVELVLGAPDVADVNGYCESQDLTAAGVFSVDATAAAAIAAAALDGTADVPRNVVAAWTTSAVLTITGTDEYGNVLVESSASGTSLTGKKAFKTVTGIATDTNITALTVGTGDVLGLPVFVPAISNIANEQQDNVVLAAFKSNVLIMDRLVEADVDAGTALNLVSPVAGVIKRAYAIVDTAVTTGGDLTFEVDTVAVNGLTLAVVGAAEGDVVSDTPTAGHATAIVAAGSRIEVIPAAALNGSADIFVVIEIVPTVTTHGTFAAGVRTEPTATTGDVRGTYDPLVACDGSLEFKLVVDLTDPADLGLDQYAG